MSASRRAFWVRSGLLGLVVFALLAFTLHSLRLSDASFTDRVVQHVQRVHRREPGAHQQPQRPGDRSPPAAWSPATASYRDDDADRHRQRRRRLHADAVELDQHAELARRSRSKLILTVEDITGSQTTLWDDDVTDLQTADPPELGTIAPLESRTYRLTLSYPDGTNAGRTAGRHDDAGPAGLGSVAVRLRATGGRRRRFGRRLQLLLALAVVAAALGAVTASGASFVSTSSTTVQASTCRQLERGHDDVDRRRRRPERGRGHRGRDSRRACRIEDGSEQPGVGTDGDVHRAVRGRLPVRQHHRDRRDG